MKRVILLIGLIFIFVLVGLLGWFLGLEMRTNESKLPINLIKSRPLDKYSFDNLASSQIQPGKIEILRSLDENDKFSSFLFTFSFNPDLNEKETKKTSGLLNIPQGSGPFPLILMLRGYVDQKLYVTGDGTKNAAEVFADNGYITVAPDFLGYGGSDEEAGSIFEARFQTYTIVLSLLKTLELIPENSSLISEPDLLTNKLINQTSIFLWGHSNGGQIALIVLEITGKTYPTTLWAPVSKPFPYSILYYTDESEDRGKLIRRELAKFESDYNPDLYSLDLYLDRIKAPLLIHHGENDDAVPIEWSNELVDKLLDLNLSLDYYKYPGADHNLRPSWDTVIARDLKFFESNLKYNVDN